MLKFDNAKIITFTVSRPLMSRKRQTDIKEELIQKITEATFEIQCI